MLFLFRLVDEIADRLDVLKDQSGLVEAELEREAILRIEDDHGVALVLADFGTARGRGFTGALAHGWMELGFEDLGSWPMLGSPWPRFRGFLCRAIFGTIFRVIPLRDSG